MAVGVLMTMPGIKRKEYEQINKKVFGHYPFDSSETPDGLLLHSAGPAPDGWWVYDIWETKDKFQTFGKKRLTPAVRDTMGAAYNERQPDFYEIVNLVPGHDAGLKRALARS